MHGVSPGAIDPVVRLADLKPIFEHLSGVICDTDGRIGAWSVVNYPTGDPSREAVCGVAEHGQGNGRSCESAHAKDQGNDENGSAEDDFRAPRNHKSTCAGG